MAKAATVPPSASGYWQVQIARSFPHAGFLYKPSHAGITVDRPVLDAMQAEPDLVTSVAAA